MSIEDGARGSEYQALISRIATLEAIVRQLPVRFAGQLHTGFRHVSFPSNHGFTIGTALRNSGTAWVAAQADSDANAFFGGLVVSVPTPKTLVLAFPGTYVRGLSITAGINYLSATTAGALTTTAPTRKVPVLMADSTTSGLVLAGASGGGGAPPTEDGTVFASDSAGTAGEWVRDHDLGRNASGKAGRLRILSPNAAGLAIDIDGSLVTASWKMLYIQEEEGCTSTGIKHRLGIFSDWY